MVAAVALAACGPDLRTTPTAVEDLFPNAPQAYTPDQDIAFGDRSLGEAYGLPRDGMSSIADLIALFPSEGVAGDEPNVFVAPDVTIPTDQCRGGAPEVRTALPMTIEAVVTLHPRQYMKVEICGQDERHYGVFTVEDDTGGIVVLRDGRAAEFTYGDRVRLHVEAVTLTFGRDADTRAILVADVEPIGMDVEPILFDPTTSPFTTDDVGQVKQVDGFVHVEPTNLNFNSMVLSSEPFSRRAEGETYTGELLQCIRSCEVRCLDGCPSSDACSDICPDICLREGGPAVNPDSLPACWLIGIDAELGRRGFAPAYGERVRATGPVVNNFDVQMWVLSTGQVETF